MSESPFFQFAYKPIIPVDATKYAKLFVRTQNLTTNNNKSKGDKKRKKPIPATIKRLVWNTHIGEERGRAKCLCCKLTDITQLSFNCGHIVAESNGGELKVSNLKPICQNCNSSMGTKNMNEFMKLLL
jgi:5-methylcytosine-specific restriction endonuclease McrA